MGEIIFIIAVLVVVFWLGRLFEQMKICAIMQKFFEVETHKVSAYSKDFCDGIFYLNDYIKKFYQ
jgi:hypothetical protein